MFTNEQGRKRETGAGAAMLGLILALTVFAAKAEGLKLHDALRFDAAMGQCRYQSSPDGMWYQKDQEHHNSYKDMCGELGISGKLNPVYGWSIRYVNLGMVHTNAYAVTCPADECDKRTAGLDPKRAECDPVYNDDSCKYRFLGGGGIKGFNFAISAEVARIKKFSLEAEAGVLLYQLRWAAQVYPLSCYDSPCQWKAGGADQKAGPFLSPMVGLTARYDLTETASVFVATRFYLRTSQHTPVSPGFSGYIQTWLAGVSFGF